MKKIFTHAWKTCPPHLNNILMLPCKNETSHFILILCTLRLNPRCIKYGVKHKVHHTHARTHARTHTHTHTHNHFTVLDFVQDYPDESVPEETFTHSHLSWSSIILHRLPPSTAIHGILPDQFIGLTVFLHNLCPNLLWCFVWHPPLHQIQSKQTDNHMVCSMARKQPRKHIGQWSTASSISDCYKPCHTCSRRCYKSSMSSTLVSHIHCWMTDQRW